MYYDNYVHITLFKVSNKVITMQIKLLQVPGRFYTFRIKKIEKESHIKTLLTLSHIVECSDSPNVGGIPLEQLNCQIFV